jgi:hypothetical protein
VGSRPIKSCIGSQRRSTRLPTMCLRQLLAVTIPFCRLLSFIQLSVADWIKHNIPSIECLGNILFPLGKSWRYAIPNTILRYLTNPAAGRKIHPSRISAGLSVYRSQFTLSVLSDTELPLDQDHAFTASSSVLTYTNTPEAITCAT